MQFIEIAKPGFTIMSGTINTLLSAMFLGAAGGVVSLADPFPEVCCELYKLAKQGNWEQAKSLHTRLIRLARSVSGSYGVAGVKFAMDLTGFHGGVPRRPLLPPRNYRARINSSGDRRSSTA